MSECMSLVQDNPRNSLGKTTIYYIAPEMKGTDNVSLGKADVFAFAVFRTQETIVSEDKKEVCVKRFHFI